MSSSVSQKTFRLMNHFMSTSRESCFTFHVACVRMLLDENNIIIGDRALFNNLLKWRLGVDSEELQASLPLEGGSGKGKKNRGAVLCFYSSIYEMPCALGYVLFIHRHTTEDQSGFDVLFNSVATTRHHHARDRCPCKRLAAPRSAWKRRKVSNRNTLPPGDNDMSHFNTTI